MKNFAFHRWFVCRQLFSAFASQLVVGSALRSRLTLRLACLERCQFAQLPVWLAQVRDWRKKAFTPIALKVFPLKRASISVIYLHSIYLYNVCIYFYIKIYFLKQFFSYFYAKFRKKTVFYINTEDTISKYSWKKYSRKIIFRLSHLFFFISQNLFDRDKYWK